MFHSSQEQKVLEVELENYTPVLSEEAAIVNYPVLKDRACKSPIDQPQLS